MNLVSSRKKNYQLKFRVIFSIFYKVGIFKNILNKMASA